MLDQQTRAQWGARSAKSRTSLAGATSLTGHYLGCDKELSGEDTSKEVAVVRNVQSFHIDGRGWADIAYNWLIGQSGVLYEGRGLGVRSAANGTNTGNSSSYAVCFMTGPSEPPSKAAVDTLNRLRIFLGFNDIKVHSEWKATACPGDYVRALRDSGGFTATPSGESPVAPVTGSDEVSAEVRVRWLQAALGGLVIDGDFGPKSSARFDENWLGNRTVFTDETDVLLINKPSVVKWFQAELNRRELASLKVDGYFGPLTASTVQGLFPDSTIVTSSTIKKLLSR